MDKKYIDGRGLLFILQTAIFGNAGCIGFFVRMHSPVIESGIIGIGVCGTLLYTLSGSK